MIGELETVADAGVQVELETVLDLTVFFIAELQEIGVDLKDGMQVLPEESLITDPDPR